MTFRFIVSLMLFSLLALRLPLCWSQSLPGADGDVAIRNAAVETVLYSFAEDVNGAYPLSRVLMGSNGRLYGTTNLSGIAGGTVFELTRSRSGVWTIMAVHDFDVNTEGAYPVAGLVFDTSGRLYGTTTLGGASNAGTVFEWFYESGAWQFKVIYTFAGGHDGQAPAGDLIFDAAGDLYGTTPYGGEFGQGTVFELVPSQGGQWTEKVLYSFRGKRDGATPVSALVFDPAGHLYGTTNQGGGAKPCPAGCGTVFKLTPNGKGKWIETVLYRFQGTTDGALPYGGLAIDQDGSLYGTTNFGGDLTCNGGTSCGTVFKIDQNGSETVLHSFTSVNADGMFPLAGLVFGPGHNLYGTTYAGGAFNQGTVFKISERGRVTTLHSFQGSPQDGQGPEAPISFDKAGNAYGTTFSGGTGSTGTVFKITR